jgi:methionyl aminopeptidase
MMTKVKKAEEILAMREGGGMLAGVLRLLEKELKPGMTTKDLSEIAKAEIRRLGGQPTFLVQYGFPDVLCVSVNDEVVHGIPGSRLINEGDLVGMDFGVTYKGMITDGAITVIAGKPLSKKDERLVLKTKEALLKGIDNLKDGIKVGTLAAAIQSVLEKEGFGIVRDLVGHGVGHELHEDPNIPNYGSKDTGPVLRAGMTIAIEPMATQGAEKVLIGPDKWTVITADGSRAAHFEHTVLITEAGAEILTA